MPLTYDPNEYNDWEGQDVDLPNQTLFNGDSAMTRKTEPKAQAGDYIRKDGELVRVKSVAEEDGVIVYYTSDGGCIADDEVDANEIKLESEAYDEIHGKRP